MQKNRNLRFDSIKECALPVLKAHEVRHAAIFGSVARGEAVERSDVDFLIEYEGNKTLFDLIDLKIALEAALRRKVDVLTYQSINSKLRDRILAEQIPIL
ncbi:MAG: nucleotidyltransferase family protein [Verrucomicrobia bacterium]|nr:nucleotidyltransferase family protein [Verrucomicrobiota bacterium]